MTMASCRSDIVARIKDSVTVRQALESYGFAVNRHGFCLCPFHSERTPSFKCYPGDRGWYCYGCHNGGDVIKLVMELEKLPFPAAVQALDNRFCIGALDAPQTEQDSEALQKACERKERRVEYQRKEAEFAACVGIPEKRDRMEYLDYWLGEHRDWR